MKPNEKLRSGFLYVLSYSIYFPLIKKILVLPVHFPQKKKHILKGQACHTEKLMVFHDTPCMPPDLTGLMSLKQKKTISTFSI